ncbi:RHS repeat-associated core domain-containing protein [Pseudomonas sp. P9_31]|uniref:RHS repeat-associated core domain-containing protein n=1 Tax=Pseudomonas sp. P9_31 TaxID=3043448 RepID=UPI002A369646|nr:RHS repeat-associated core domain-containing protein [Pseudomonas sp. P9_31]WPN58699.1 RHS repeat-associated core domain-containing protein [Pseudomonas sp. P9_31]
MSGSGLPVSHVGEKVSGNVIATGSPNVRVGSMASGQADRASACVPFVGQPVNPILGCKLLPEEVDFALAAPDTFSFGRGYLSSNPRISRLGQGWWLPGESLLLELNADGCVLIDAQGRRITFPPLAPGATWYSGSEQLWLRRGDTPDERQEHVAWTGRWARVAPALQRNPNVVVVLDGNSYLSFARQANDLWRLHSTFGRSGYPTLFNWSPRGFLTSIRDSAGRSYVLLYQQVCQAQPGDDGVRLCGVVLANPDGPVPEHFDPQSSGNDWLVRYQFNESGDLIAVRDRLGVVVRVFAWNNHIMVAHSEPGGLEVRYEWDGHRPDGRVLRQIETDGLVREFRYYSDATDVVDSLGRTERYEFSGQDGERRWTALIRPDGSRTSFEHDMFGRQVAVRDPLGRESRRQLDGQGRVLAERSPGKKHYRQTLDEETGLLKELIDAMGRRWIFERNETTSLTCVSGPTGTIRYHYDDSTLPNRATRISDSKGGVKQVQWNRLGLPSRITDCSGQTHSYEYDSEGRLLAETDPAGRSTCYVYNRLGQVIEVTLADGTRLAYHYDAQGRQTHIADTHGHCTQLEWDRVGRLVRATDSTGDALDYRYDAAGRLCRITNQNGAQATFAFDTLDRLVEENGFDGRRQHYRYNLAGELVTRIDAEGRETHYEYNRDSQLIRRHLPATATADAFSEHYGWLPDGRLAMVKGPDCEVRLAYDPAGNLSLESQIHADGWVYSVTHQHDALGVRESSRYGDAPPITWLTYGSGHLHGVLAAHAEMAFERDALHREQRREARLKGKPHALLEQGREHDAMGRLTRSRITLATAEDWQREYRYDPLGQLVQVDDNLRPGLRYRYDRGGRLDASQHGSEVPNIYRYDPAGNRLDSGQQQAGDQQRQYAHNELYRSGYVGSQFDSLQAAQPPGAWSGNRVERLEGHEYRFDAQGNLVARHAPDGEHLHLEYDGANRLVSATRQRADGVITQARYRYDGLSRRIAKVVRQDDGQQVIRFGWDGERQCAEVFDDLLRTTVHEPDSFIPLLRIEQNRKPDSADLLMIRREMAAADQPLPEQCHPALGAPAIGFFHTDHIGTPLRLDNEQGRTIWQAHNDDWRAVKQETGPADQPIRFQGQYHDRESGLYYNRHRYYLPEAGRYASQDPIGFRGGPNAYAYALNAPSVAYDPSGLIVPLLIIGGFLARAALGATIEVGMQAGKQVLGQMKDNWDNDRELTDIKWRCIDINLKHVGVAAAAGALAPGMLSSAKTVYKSAKAYRALSGQAANTANRAAKLAVRKAAHADTIKTAVKVQAGFQVSKAIVKCVSKDEEDEC